MNAGRATDQAIAKIVSDTYARRPGGW